MFRQRLSRCRSTVFPVMRTLVLNCNDERPIWAIPGTAVETIRQALPPDWRLHVVSATVNSRGDGSSSSPEVIDASREAEVYIGSGVPAEVIAAARRLRWAHTTNAGVSSLMYPEMLASEVVLTNAAGIHAEPMAESVLAMMLYFARGLDHAVEAQRRGVWDETRFVEAGAQVRELSRSTIGIVGLGGIGKAIARRAEALGMTVLFTNSRSTRADLDRLLRSSHYVVIAVPDTPSTRSLIGAAEIDSMRHDAVLINVARGAVVDEAALGAALEAGRIRGAGLDVFGIEPLPSDSPLWRTPGVLITPHASAASWHYWERQLALILENLNRYLSGKTLLNLVDKRRGY